MAAAVVFAIGLVGTLLVTSSSRALRQRKAKKAGLDYHALQRDKMGRAIDPNDPDRRLSKNEERAVLEHLKLSSQEQAKLEQEHGPVLPDYEAAPPRYVDKALASRSLD
ncbi:hypothetical protein CBOM_06805 [Ceraceosorus bombacis]|uniref:Uncharacterized protein n=1 Tax=Ceraceosorus bombacis TaxID=401625 RepID=A0A0P1BTK9_9BASI|nr:hypothetical protein CBOM_06805 [Ceraceosorus bombacis]